MTSELAERDFTPSERQHHAGDPEPSGTWALRGFVAVEAAAFVYYLALSRRTWFFADEWEFLSGRGLGVHDLLRAHYGHWTAVPIVVYRVMWWAVGLRSYLPYVALTVGLHLTAAALLRVVMRRSGVRPWIATAVASAFVCFGPGAQDILWAFQIAFTGALVLGLADLLLTDHLGPVDRRDWIGLGAGTLALMCSGVAVTMVIVVGLAALFRRGWRVALLHTAPLGLLYVLWWARYSSGRHSFVGSMRQITDWSTTGIGAVFGELGRVPGAGWLLAAVLVGGLALVVHVSGWRTLREPPAVPIALLIGVVVFFLITGIDRSGRGVTFVRSGRYLHIAGALALPAIAVAVEAFFRRWRTFGVIALATLLVGVPGNIGKAHDYLDGLLVQNQTGYRQMMLSVARAPVTADIPDSLRPDPGLAPTVTLRWLHAGVASGRVPKSRPSTPEEVRMNRLRLSLMELDERSGLPCHPLRTPIVLVLAVGNRIGIAGTVRVRLVAHEAESSSSFVSFGGGYLNATFVHTLVAVAGPLTLRIAPAGRLGTMLCTAGN
jgi:hypothetical protein